MTVNDNIDTSKMTAIHTENIETFLDLSTAIDVEEERCKINKELKTAESELNRAKGMLANERFVSKAPAELIEREKEKIVKYETLIQKLQETLSKL